MKKLILLLAFIHLIIFSYSQGKYFTRKGHVSFLSQTPSDKIEAHNYQVASILNASTGEIDFTILIKSFEFKKVLMQEHFNENYMESDKFPKASFKGKIKNYENLHVKKEGTYTIEVEGDLTIHGITKLIIAPGTLEIKGEQIIAKATFPVTLKEYNILIPKISQQKISETVQVSVDLIYLPYGKK
jgi:polyisoprenoid-binding protein YceI